MTYKEREKQLCRECSMKETCPYIPRKMEYKCQHLSDMMYGWELGYKDAIEKAREWMDEFLWWSSKPLYQLIEDFKKAMEE